nr:C-X-C motif chemokine 11 [Vicugna pacos]
MSLKSMVIVLAVILCATTVKGIWYFFITLKAHKGQRCLNSKSKQANVIIKKVERMNFLKYQNI